MATLITTQELAAEMQVPVATVYRWNTEGTGPTPLKIGKHVRYRREDVDAWLAGKAQEGVAGAIA